MTARLTARAALASAAVVCAVQLLGTGSAWAAGPGTGTPVARASVTAPAPAAAQLAAPARGSGSDLLFDLGAVLVAGVATVTAFARGGRHHSD